MGDLLYNIAEWLRTTALMGLADSLSQTGINSWIVNNFWAIPIFQMIHILALAGSFGAVLMMTLRVQGWAGVGLNPTETAARYLPWMRWGLVVLALSGLMLILGEPHRELINPIFWIKIVLLALTLLFSISFFKRLSPPVEGGEFSGAAKAGAALLVVLWCVIMLCGRWIAYAPI